LGCTDFVLLSTLDWSGHGPWLNDVGLDEATFYSYRVRHAGSTGSSAFSSVATALTGHAQPLQVLDLRSFYENRQVALFWTDAAGNETRYEVERYRVGSGETSFRTIAVLPPDSTSFIDASTQVGAIYVYRVRPWRFDVFGGAPDVTTVAAN
jgi:titin